MAKGDKLHRRTIRQKLMDGYGWVVKSRVDGWVEVTIPAGKRGNVKHFAAEVDRAVRDLGYEPTIAMGPGTVLVRTPETLEQAGRGAHGFVAAPAVDPPPKTPPPHREQVAVSSGHGEPAALELPPTPPLGQWVHVLRSDSEPYCDMLSVHTALVAWHLDLRFERYVPTPEEQARWADSHSKSSETWNKLLLVGRESGCRYSCGELEIAARLRATGYQAFWISEWSGFQHVPEWKPFCLTRKELRERLPKVWEFDKSLREQFPQLRLGTSGGHPDVVAWLPGSETFVFVEYKGPGDSINEKQAAFATALHLADPDTHRYAVVRGTVL